MGDNCEFVAMSILYKMLGTVCVVWSIIHYFVQLKNII